MNSDLSLKIAANYPRKVIKAILETLYLKISLGVHAPRHPLENLHLWHLPCAPLKNSTRATALVVLEVLHDVRYQLYELHKIIIIILIIL